jgi:hypothetical protein
LIVPQNPNITVRGILEAEQSEDDLEADQPPPVKQQEIDLPEIMGDLRTYFAEQ